MKIVLSYFDQRIGPRIVYSSEKIAPALEGRITDLMDINHNLGFVEQKFIFNNVCEVLILSYAFTLESPWARGNHELLTLNLVLDAHHETAPLKKLIEEFITRIKSYKVIYKGLHDPKEKSDMECQTYEEILHAIFMEFSLKAEDLMKSLITGDIFVMGDDTEGKNQFVAALCTEKTDILSENGGSFEIKHLSQDNMLFRMYKIQGDEKFQEMWLQTTQPPDGCVYIIDGSKNLENLAEQTKIKGNLTKIVNKFVRKHGKGTRVPLLVMINHSDPQTEASLETIKKNFTLANTNVKQNFVFLQPKNKTTMSESMKWVISDYYKTHYTTISNKQFANKFDKWSKNF